ncbi:MAG: hypothetical protein FWE28_09395, partial [Oscillospiraceae bacterium]|nr:hypothetical protein [Oscillospiraceae bacterium]
MKKHRRVLAIILALVMVLGAVPPALAQEELGYEDITVIAAPAPTLEDVAQLAATIAPSVQVDPTVQFQTMDGWGTTIAWWGNLVGSWVGVTSPESIAFGQAIGWDGDMEIREMIVYQLFHPDHMNMNVARFQIGGGDGHDGFFGGTQIRRPDARMIGWTFDMLGQTYWDPNCPDSWMEATEYLRDPEHPFWSRPIYAMHDWAQLWVLETATAIREQALYERGLPNDMIIETFAKSPPYYMTFDLQTNGSMRNPNDWGESRNIGGAPVAGDNRSWPGALDVPGPGPIGGAFTTQWNLHLQTVVDAGLDPADVTAWNVPRGENHNPRWWQAHARYMVIATQYIENFAYELGVPVKALNPFNEPTINWGGNWGAMAARNDGFFPAGFPVPGYQVNRQTAPEDRMGPPYWSNMHGHIVKQEGNMLRISSQNDIVRMFVEELDDWGLGHVKLAAPGDSNHGAMVRTWDMMTEQGRADVPFLSTHSYGTSDGYRRVMRDMALTRGGDVWQTEVGFGGGANQAAGWNPYSMYRIGTRGQAATMIRDLRIMQTPVWVNWIALENSYNMMQENTMWGIVHANLASPVGIRWFGEFTCELYGCEKDGAVWERFVALDTATGQPGTTPVVFDCTDADYGQLIGFDRHFDMFDQKLLCPRYHNRFLHTDLHNSPPNNWQDGQGPLQPVGPNGDREWSRYHVRNITDAREAMLDPDNLFGQFKDQRFWFGVTPHGSGAGWEGSATGRPATSNEHMAADATVSPERWNNRHLNREQLPYELHNTKQFYVHQQIGQFHRQGNTIIDMDHFGDDSLASISSCGTELFITVRNAGTGTLGTGGTIDIGVDLSRFPHARVAEMWVTAEDIRADATNFPGGPLLTREEGMFDPAYPLHDRGFEQRDQWNMRQMEDIDVSNGVLHVQTPRPGIQVITYRITSGGHPGPGGRTGYNPLNERLFDDFMTYRVFSSEVMFAPNTGHSAQHVEDIYEFVATGRYSDLNRFNFRRPNGDANMSNVHNRTINTALNETLPIHERPTNIYGLPNWAGAPAGTAWTWQNNVGGFGGSSPHDQGARRTTQDGAYFTYRFDTDRLIIRGERTNVTANIATFRAYLNDDLLGTFTTEGPNVNPEAILFDTGIVERNETPHALDGLPTGNTLRIVKVGAAGRIQVSAAWLGTGDPDQRVNAIEEVADIPLSVAVVGDDLNDALPTTVLVSGFYDGTEFSNALASIEWTPINLEGREWEAILATGWATYNGMTRLVRTTIEVIPPNTVYFVGVGSGTPNQYTHGDAHHATSGHPVHTAIVERIDTDLLNHQYSDRASGTGANRDVPNAGVFGFTQTAMTGGGFLGPFPNPAHAGTKWHTLVHSGNNARIPGVNDQNQDGGFNYRLPVTEPGRYFVTVGLGSHTWTNRTVNLAAEIRCSDDNTQLRPVQDLFRSWWSNVTPSTERAREMFVDVPASLLEGRDSVDIMLHFSRGGSPAGQGVIVSWFGVNHSDITSWDALIAAIAQAGTRVQATYTATSWTVLANTVTEGNRILDSISVSQQDVDDATQDILDAIAALVVRGEVPCTDALEAAIAVAEAFNDPRRYTTTSWTDMQDALVHARATLVIYQDVTQDDVDDATRDLVGAIAALQRAFLLRVVIYDLGHLSDGFVAMDGVVFNETAHGVFEALSDTPFEGVVGAWIGEGGATTPTRRMVPDPVDYVQELVIEPIAGRTYALRVTVEGGAELVNDVAVTMPEVTFTRIGNTWIALRDNVPFAGDVTVTATRFETTVTSAPTLGESGIQAMAVTPESAVGDGMAFVVERVYAEPGAERVEVNIFVEDNSGGFSSADVTIAFDNTRVSLVGHARGDLLPAHRGIINQNRFTLIDLTPPAAGSTWEDWNVMDDGLLLTLFFDVLTNEEDFEFIPITLTNVRVDRWYDEMSEEVEDLTLIGGGIGAGMPPAPVVESIAVTTQPTMLVYTEGETLDLDGLVVTLTYDDGSNREVAFADFAANGMTVNPAAGTVLALTHDGTVVTITHTESEETATTDSLTVNAPVVASIAVTTQPTALVYTEHETLDLDGLVVTLTYSNGTTRTVAFADFAANGLTTSPAAGTLLLWADNDTPITITHTESGATATTDNLTVNILWGDVNNDGDVTLGDVSLLNLYVLGFPVLDTWMYRGDVNHDGDVTLGDVSLLNLYVLGFPVRITPPEATAAAALAPLAADAREVVVTATVRDETPVVPGAEILVDFALTETPEYGIGLLQMELTTEDLTILGTDWATDSLI